jgi:hypothetical protein
MATLANDKEWLLLNQQPAASKSRRWRHGVALVEIPLFD